MSRRAFMALLGVLLAAFVYASRADAQSAGTTNLLSAPGAWPTSGAPDATTALGLDPSAIYLNPAGLAAQDERSFLFHHGMLQFDTGWDVAAVSYPIPGLGAVGLGAARIGTSGIDAYDAQNQPLGSIGYSETSLAASVARRLYGPVVAGATFKVLTQSLGDASAAAPAIDLGFVYKPQTLRGAQVGLAVQNLVAGSLDLGGSAPSVDRGYRIGLASPEWRFSRLVAARGAVDLSRQGGDGGRARVALEVNRPGWGSLRAGFNAGRPVFGVGVKYRRYGLDLAMEQGEVEATQQLALHVAWGEPVSEYEARRRAEYSKAAEESVLARRSALLVADRKRAEAAEASGDWEGALLHWEFLHRERPAERTYSERADRARTAIRVEAKAAVERESARRLDAAFMGLTRDALARGDVEEALGLWRGFARRPATGGGTGTPETAGTGAPPESVAVLDAAVRQAAERELALAVSRGDSLRDAGRVLAAAEAAALALRLNPEDPRALDLWASLEEGVGKSAENAAALSRKLEALTAVQNASKAFNEGRYGDAQTSVRRALALDPGSAEAKAWKERVQRRLTTPRPELDARIKLLYIEGMEAFAAGDYRAALKSWEQILVIDPLNESARRNVLEARDRLKAEARR